MATEKLCANTDAVRNLKSKILLCDVMHNWETQLQHKKRMNDLKAVRNKEFENQKLKEIEVERITAIAALNFPFSGMGRQATADVERST